jgi:hypothetical protein
MNGFEGMAQVVEYVRPWVEKPCTSKGGGGKENGAGTSGFPQVKNKDLARPVDHVLLLWRLKREDLEFEPNLGYIKTNKPS